MACCPPVLSSLNDRICEVVLPLITGGRCNHPCFVTRLPPSTALIIALTTRARGQTDRIRGRRAPPPGPHRAAQRSRDVPRRSFRRLIPSHDG